VHISFSSNIQVAAISNHRYLARAHNAPWKSRKSKDSGGKSGLVETIAVIGGSQPACCSLTS